jgi:SAM-dependent methyltransferase
MRVAEQPASCDAWLVHWTDDDDLWKAIEPFLFPAERIASAAEEVAHAMQLAGAKPGARVLDLGCGPGRHAIALARAGYHVTGVDRTAGYLDRGREVAAAEGLDIEWTRADMREFERAGAFDAAINLFSTFGYFDDDENLRIAKNLCGSLVRGGAAVFELAGKERVASVFRERDWEQVDGALLLEEHRVAPGWEHIDNRWIVIRNNQRREFQLRLRLFSGGELRALLQAAGFAAVDLYGSFQGTPYDRSARRLIAVARC